MLLQAIRPRTVGAVSVISPCPAWYVRGAVLSEQGRDDNRSTQIGWLSLKMTRMARDDARTLGALVTATIFLGFCIASIRADAQAQSTYSQSSPCVGGTNKFTIACACKANLTANAVIAISGPTNVVAVALLGKGDEGLARFVLLVLLPVLFCHCNCGLRGSFYLGREATSSRVVRRHRIYILSLALSCHFAIARGQSFTTKGIGQSTPAEGKANTITVTLVTDIDLKQADSSAVTISGLSNAVATSPVTLLDAGDDGETLFSDGTTQSRGAWSSGTLTLTVHSSLTMSAGTTYRFSFVVMNPGSAQASPTVNIEASGSATIASSALTKPNSELFGVSNGTNPLEVVVPVFSAKGIGQSTPGSGETNTITVTLTANYNLDDTSTVTISGLTGSQTLDSTSLAVTSTGGLLGTTGAWTQSSGTLVLTAASGGTTQGTACEVTFALKNKATTQTSPAVSVEAAISDGSSTVANIAQVAMDKPGSDLFGVSHGADPLEVSVIPAAFFTIKNCRQSNPFVGGTNIITIVLACNATLTAHSVVTISGLTNAVATSPISLLDKGNDGEMIFTDGMSQRRGSWSSGTLTLTVYSNSTLRANTTYTFAFAVTNPSEPQSAPTIKVAASGSASIPPAAMTKPGTSLLGVPHGEDPLLIFVPDFSYSLVMQMNPASGHSNRIIVIFRANCELLSGSKVTVSGLTGSQTADDNAHTVQAVPPLNPLHFASSGAWNNSGSMVLTVTSPGIRNEINETGMAMFSLTNPAAAQASPPVNLSATIEDGAGNILGSISAVKVAKDQPAMFGIPHGGDPLFVVVPAFLVKTIGQSTPVPSVNNTLTMTIATNFDLSAGSKVTVSGLTGSQTADASTVTVRVPSGGLPAWELAGTWTRSSGSLVLTVKSQGKILSGTTANISFTILNPASTQISPSVSISAEINDEKGNYGTITQVAMEKPIAEIDTNNLYGVYNGRNPLEIVLPAFTVKSIAQTNPVAGAKNTLVATLTANYNLAAGSQITIAGLKRTATQDSDALNVSSTGGYVLLVRILRCEYMMIIIETPPADDVLFSVCNAAIVRPYPRIYDTWRAIHGCKLSVIVVWEH